MGRFDGNCFYSIASRRVFLTIRSFVVASCSARMSNDFFSLSFIFIAVRGSHSPATRRVSRALNAAIILSVYFIIIVILIPFGLARVSLRAAWRRSRQIEILTGPSAKATRRET